MDINTLLDHILISCLLGGGGGKGGGVVTLYKGTLNQKKGKRLPLGYQAYATTSLSRFSHAYAYVRMSASARNDVCV